MTPPQNSWTPEEAADSGMPVDYQTERATLGAVLWGGLTAFRRAEQIITAAAFYHPSHRYVFETMRALASSETAIDETTMRAALLATPPAPDLPHSTSLLAQIGGDLALTYMLEECTSPANIEYYARRLVITETSRYMCEMAKALFREGRRGEEGLRAIAALNGRTHLAEIAQNALQADPPSMEQRHIPVLPDAALYGLAGEFVHLWAPHTEASRPAMLLQFLVAIGSALGRNAYYPISGMRHHTNLFLVVVGRSAKSRKGTSYAPVRCLLQDAAPDFVKRNIKSGLSSGEGLLAAVRDDAMVASEQSEEAVVARGVDDKRLLVVETEFGSVLEVLRRDGNTLSAQVRDAWDTGDLQTLTKKEVHATGAHISIIGHITRDELRKKLSECDTLNGFGNRFLWAYADRGDLKPFGGMPERSEALALAARIADALTSASMTEQMQMSQSARDLWFKIYSRLEADVPGLVGALVSRSSPNVIRMSMIYALLESCEQIETRHLDAALAVWQYCEDSARYIFGTSSGDPVADDILRAIKATAHGMSRTEISSLFDRNLSKARISAALETLEERNQIEKEKRTPSGAGKRPIEVWKSL